LPEARQRFLTPFLWPAFGIKFLPGVRKGLGDRFRQRQRPAIGIIEIGVGNKAAAVGEIDNRPLVIRMVIEEANAGSLHGKGLISLLAMTVSSYKGVRPIIFQRNILPS